MEKASSRSKAITIKDVAKSANVSIATVSLVLRNKPDRLVRIPETTRQRVREAARRLNYKPNRLAQQFARQQSNCLGVVLPGDPESLSTPYFGVTLAGIVAEATRLRCGAMSTITSMTPSTRCSTMDAWHPDPWHPSSLRITRMVPRSVLPFWAP